MEREHADSMITIPNPTVYRPQSIVVRPPKKIRRAKQSTHGDSPTHSVYTTHTRDSGVYTTYEPQNSYNKYD